MGADQQFCLRWNNFHTNITSAFESLRDDEDFVDITLACEGKQVKAHKMVLSACSPYFRSLLKGNPCQHPIVFLKDVTFANLSSILDFMYHGEVNVSNNELATFLNTAEALKVRGLAEDDKKKDSESCNESSSPPPPREPPDPGAPRPEEGNTADTHLSDSPPPKRQRRRSGASVHSTEDTNETVLSEVRECASVKNEPQDFNEDDDILMSHSLETTELIKTDSHGEDNSEERSFGPSESVTISRSQAAMQQLQESFSSFLPGMGQSSGFLSHGASDMSRPPPFPMEGVQGLPPGISALPGPSMSQGGGAASQDASQGGGRRSLLHTACICPYCHKVISNKYNLKTHIVDKHTIQTERFTCELCGRVYSTKHSLATHTSTVHRGDKSAQQTNQFHSSQSSNAIVVPSTVDVSQLSQNLHLEDLQQISPSDSHISDRSPIDQIESPSVNSHISQINQRSVTPDLSIMSHEHFAGTSSMNLPRRSSTGNIPTIVDDDICICEPDNGITDSSSGSSLAKIASRLPPAQPLEGAPPFDQIQAMAQTLFQNFPH